MYEIELVGIDGANLLGYLAALGTLRTLTLADPGAEVRMRWADGVRWTPIVCHSRISGQEGLVGALAPRVTPAVAVRTQRGVGRRQAGALSKDEVEKATANCNRGFSRDFLNLTRAGFRAELEGEALGPAQRDVADFLTAIGSDCFPEKKGSDEPGTTELRAIGAGNNDGFLGLMRNIHVATGVEDLRKALFAEWDYSDPPPFMRWDPNEFRPHALRAGDPAKDNKRNNVRGANRLAIEALPLFPTVPQRAVLRTVAFGDKDARAEVTWPIWLDPLSLNVVASLLACEDVQEADHSTLARRGVAQVFRAKRFTDGQYRNFSPARALL